MLSPGINLLKWIQARVVQPVDSLAEILVKITWLTFRTHIISASSDARGGLALPGWYSCSLLPVPHSTMRWQVLVFSKRHHLCQLFLIFVKVWKHLLYDFNHRLVITFSAVIWGPKWHFVLLYIFQQSVILLFSNCTI